MGATDSATASPPKTRTSPPSTNPKSPSTSPQPTSPGSAASAGPGLTITGAIEAAAADHVEDESEFDLAEGYETGSAASTSATSSIYAHTYENGRRYQHFKNGRYPIPNDDAELSREDMKHAMLLEMTDGKLFYAPVGDHPQKILDVATGTGIWAIDVADQYPSARVRGIDLSPVQPLWMPPNCDFFVDDAANDFVWGDVDLVHYRFATTVLKNIPLVLHNTIKSLKPGGWVEIQELCADPLCDDATMPDNDPVKYMYKKTQQGFAEFGMDLLIPKGMRRYLEDAGFQNIQCIVKKVPIGVWARDKTLRLIGMYQKTAVQELLQALAGRPLAAAGLSPTESQVVVAHARAGLEDNQVHRYFEYYFWYAQKPLGH